VEAHFGAIVERLKALDIDAFELEQNLALHKYRDASRGDKPILNCISGKVKHQDYWGWGRGGKYP
jgi:hypothetical protein